MSFPKFTKRGIRIGNPLPATAHVGLQFRPDGTDSIATVLGLSKAKVRGRETSEVTYTFEHSEGVTYSRPYSEVQRMAWAVD